MENLGKKKEDRIEFVKNQLLMGKTLREVGTSLGLSAARIGQIVKKYLNIPRGDRGITKKVFLRKEAKAKSLSSSYGRESYFCEDDLTRRKGLLFSRKKGNAKKTGYDWTIKLGELDWPEVCPVLGIPLNYYAENREEGSPSFDRIDNSKGYVTGNVKIISWRANRIKNDGTKEEHLKIAEYLSQY